MLVFSVDSLQYSLMFIIHHDSLTHVGFLGFSDSFNFYGLLRQPARYMGSGFLPTDGSLSSFGFILPYVTRFVMTVFFR